MLILIFKSVDANQLTGIICGGTAPIGFSGVSSSWSLVSTLFNCEHYFIIDLGLFYTCALCIAGAEPPPKMFQCDLSYVLSI